MVWLPMVLGLAVVVQRTAAAIYGWGRARYRPAIVPSGVDAPAEESLAV